MLSSAGQGVRSSQVACFGQDTTQLHKRPGKRSWRAEVAASDANKADGAAALQWMRATFPLAALALDAAEGQHEAYLKGLLHPGSGHGRATVLHRLKLASAAAARRKTLRILAPNQAFALPPCTDFVSYVRQLPHGSTATITQRPRLLPFGVGAFAGLHACCPHVLLSLSCPRFELPLNAIQNCIAGVPHVRASSSSPASGAPAMTKNNSLRFSGGHGPRHILMMDPACEVDLPEGCVMQDADGVFVSMKLPWVDRLPKATHDVLLKLAIEWGEMVAHIPRGGRKASVSNKFYCGGLKGDTDSGLELNLSEINKGRSRYCSTKLCRVKRDSAKLLRCGLKI